MIFVLLLLVGWYGYRQAENPIEEEFEEGEEILTENIPFENLFRQYAPEIGWPWELLAALCWEESHWNPNACSATGAKGLMQYIKFLQRTYEFITDSAENQHFVLASYNAGPAHIMDARRLAKRYGRSPYIWFDNTEYWLTQLQYPEVAADSVVLYGSFNPTETVSYVRKVKRTHKRILKMK